MAIFSRRKNSKAKLDDNETGSLHGAGKSKSEQLLSTFSPSSTGEVLSDILQRRDPQKPLKPALSRASNSDSSVYLTMYAVNNRLRMSSTSLDAEFASANPWIETKQRAPRSPIPKKVSFIITEKEASQDEKRSPSTSPLSTPPLLAVDSESNGDDSSSLYSATSSEYSDSSECIELPVSRSPPRKPKHVAHDFQRRMDRLPPVRRRDANSRPKVTLVHSKDGQPSWLVKSAAVTAH